MVISFFPVFVVFLVGILTHRVIPALFFGLIAAILVATNFSPPEALSLLVSQLWNNLEIEKFFSFQTFRSASQLHVIAFVVLSSLMFDFIRESRGTWAILHIISKRIHNKKNAETASLILSHCFFIDGLMSSMMVSSLMRPFSKIHGIPKEKIALLADSMATPLAVLCPFSCFTALLISILSKHGTGTAGSGHMLIDISPNILYLLSLPFFFYSMILTPMIWLVVRKRLSWGPMRVLEKDSSKEAIDLEKECGNASVWDFLVPAVSFIILIPLLGILLTEESGVFSSCPVALVLFLSSLISIILSVIYYLAVGRFTPIGIVKITFTSLKNIGRCITLILFAWTFASIMNHQLQIGLEIKSLISGKIPLFLLPVIFFLLSGMISMSLGTSWGTAVIFLPISIPMIFSFHEINHTASIDEVPTLLPVIGAIVSGSCLGDHLSILSDSTILSARGAGCGILEHFKTQLPYGVPVIISTSIGFLIAGLSTKLPLPFSFLIPLLASTSVIFFMLSAQQKRARVYQDW